MLLLFFVGDDADDDGDIFSRDMNILTRHYAWIPFPENSKGRNEAVCHDRIGHTEQEV